jgi:pyruvate kinase
LEAGKVELVKDQTLELIDDYSFRGNSNRIACSYKELSESVHVGALILIADGSITCKVLETQPGCVKVQVMNPATLGEKKNMNLPGVIVKLPTVTEKDIDDLINFGIKEKVDLIAASFVRKAEDVHNIRKILGKEGEFIKIISKIENQEGLNNYHEILKASDGIMVARGDMGMEIPMEKVFIAQKYMIDGANLAGKPIVTATQMLESMCKNPRPTRAETTDVANAVLDGTDCVMLSGETAGGLYPVESVEIMARICREAESSINYMKMFELLKSYSEPMTQREKACCELVGKAAEVSASLIIVATRSGKLARFIAKYRPQQMVLAVTNADYISRQLNTSRGVIGFKTSSTEKLIGEEAINEAIKYSLDSKLVKKGDKILQFVCSDEDAKNYEKDFKIITA